MRQCATMRAHAAGCGLGWLGFSEPMLGRSAFEGGRRSRDANDMFDWRRRIIIGQ
jgi:hypothetical protein